MSSTGIASPRARRPGRCRCAWRGAAKPTRAGRACRVAAWLLLLVLAGCSSQRHVTLPPPPWPHEQAPLPGPEPDPLPPSRAEPWGDQVLPRSRWAQGTPAAARMNPMTPVRSITLHHDGMDAFYAVDAASAADRIERIRRLHRGKGWGDIGYHFAVDRAGRVWEGRPLRYQGAHVKDHNPGNIGIVALGNFEEQSIPSAQLEGIRRCLEMLMRTYGVPVNRVRSHREWPGAATACPGGRLQECLESLRAGPLEALAAR